MANILPPSLTTFNFERFVGSRTSLQPFLLHWLTLFICLLLVALMQYKLSLSYSAEVLLSGIVLLTVASVLFLPEMYGGGRVISTADLQEFEEHLAERSRKARANFNTFQQTYRASPSPTSPLLQSPSQSSANDESPVTRQKTMLYSDFLPEISGHGAIVFSFLHYTYILQMYASHKYVYSDGTASETQPLTSGTTTTTTTTEYESISTYIDDCYYGDSQPLSNTFFMWRMWALFAIFLSAAGSG